MTRSGGPDGQILIAGAGIAGLCAAIALKIAGLSPVVLEREPQLQAIGAGLQLGPNATRLLASWGVALARPCAPERLIFRTMRTGGRLNALPLGETARKRYGAPYLTALRADLQEALLSRARALDVPLYFGVPVESLAQESRTVTVVAGGAARKGRALIGADGLRSTVRQAVRPESRAIATGATVFRAVLPVNEAPESFRENAIGLWMGEGAHLVHYPVSGGELINAAFVVERDWRSAAGSGARRKRDLLSRFVDHAEPALGLIDVAQDWQPWPIHVVRPLSNPCQGRVCLIGDAAHAMAPHLASGAVMAMEDAAALARAFAQASGDTADAFRAYESARNRRVAKAAYRSGLMGRVYHLSGPAARIRDAVITAMPPGRLLAQNDWLYGDCMV